MESAKKYAISVSAETQYIAGESDEAKDRFVFSYTVTIRNSGTMPAQLISRHWIITDARNQVQEVRGLGVVGAQPLLKPRERFEYTSGTAIATPGGAPGLALPYLPANNDYVGIDLTRAMLSRVPASPSPLTLVHGNVMRLPFADERFDCAVMHL